MKKNIELTQEDRNSLVKYRIERAKETLAEANILINDNFNNAAMNRLYYACYYAVIALLIKNKINAQTHQGVIQMFSLHFVVTEKIDKSFSTFYGKLFKHRISGDYDDYVVYKKELLLELRPQAELFIKKIEELTLENK